MYVIPSIYSLDKSSNQQLASYLINAVMLIDMFDEKMHLEVNVLHF